MGIVEKIYVKNRDREAIIEYSRAREPLSLRATVMRRREQGELAVISEFKRRSPSGFMKDSGTEVDEYVRHVVSLGTDAISILTEPSYFAGSYEDIMRVNDIHVPILMKDFVSTVEMVESGYNSGADAVLLIADFLSEDTLVQLTEKASSLSMDSLVEFHSQAGLQKISRIRNMGNVLIGYNRRNLATMEMDPGCGYIPEVKRAYPCILESGVNPKSIPLLPLSSFDGVLVGESMINGQMTPEFFRRVNA